MSYIDIFNNENTSLVTNEFDLSIYTKGIVSYIEGFEENYSCVVIRVKNNEIYIPQLKDGKNMDVNYNENRICMTYEYDTLLERIPRNYYDSSRDSYMIILEDNIHRLLFTHLKRQDRTLYFAFVSIDKCGVVKDCVIL